ncbi:hypothetical protein DFH06DRAFT_1153022 [Mycena polygramma]|nr:hypothetical protein DFH06DRAFT_1153022 [Mycena polygramma]
MRMRQLERRTIRTDKRKYTLSEDLGAAESADSAGLIGIGGGIVGDEPAEVGRQGSVGSLEGIRKAKVCRKMKRDTEVKPEKDRRDRRSTIEEEEDVEKVRMMTEATGGGWSIGSGETRKVNRDNRKRRKSRRRSKVDTEAHGGARGRSVLERPKSRSSREGRKRESAWPHGRKLAEKSFGIGKESGKRKASRTFRGGKRRMGRPEYRPSWMENDLKQVKVVRERDRNQRPRPRDTGDSIKAERDSADGQDRRWRTRIGEWNEKSRSLMDQYSISEARRFGVGVAATSERWPRRPQTPQTHQMKCEQDAAQPRDLGREHGLETRRLVEGKVNAKLSKVGSEVGSGEIREEVG